MENLKHFMPTTGQYEKFAKINEMSDDEWTKLCVFTNDCSICDMAIHQMLISTEKHTCVYGMSKERFECCIDNADIEF